MRNRLSERGFGIFSLGIFAIAFLLPAVEVGAQQFGGIRGQVVDSDFGQPIGKASVTVLDTPFGAMTDDQGNFTISGVPTGAYTLSVRSSGYLPKLVPSVAVGAGEFNDLRVETIAEVEELEELVVPGELDKTSEVGLLAERQDATAVMDIMGADLIARLGAATAGDALKSMVGTSVVDGKYVVVRGLSDRYVNTLLNGGRLPSTDPDKRAINVDLFPGPTLESLNTTKTFTPDQPGDFTGGSVDIRTKTFPEKPSFGTSVRVEYNSQATFNPNFLTYAGGGTGPFGFQANKRLIPDAVINAPILSTPAATDPITLNINTPGDLDKAEEINSLQRQLTPVVGLTNKAVGPNTSVNLQGGDSVQLGEEEIFGIFGAFSQRNDYSTLGNASRVPSFEVENIGGVNVLVPQAETSENRGTQDNLWGTLVNMAYQPAAEQKIAVNFLFNQQASDVADYQIDSTTVPGVDGQYQVINYSQRTLAFLQFNGNHLVEPLGALQVDWVGGVGQSTLTEPDQRIFMNQFNPTTGIYQRLGQSNYSPSGTTDPLQRFQRALNEGNYNFLANLGLPFFPEDKGNPSKFKTGFYIDTSQREYNQNYFKYSYGDSGDGTYDTFGGAGDPSNGNNWSQVFLNEDRSGLVNEAGQLGNDRPMSWTLGNFSGQTGNFYNAYQQVLASYTMAELRLFPQLTLVGGARFENTNLQVRGANNLPSTLFPDPNFSGGGSGLAKIQQLDLLPSVGATFQLMENVNFRFAWSQTIARPSFKEMGPVVTQDFADSAIFLGNPSLRLSSINNYDFRAEYFPRAGEVLAFSLFYKLIDQPIEQSRVAIGNEGTEYFRYVNNPTGTLYGAEFEVRKRLDQVASWLKNFSFNFNYTYTQSQVQLTPEQIVANQSVGILETTRPLQGQPQYICNAGLSYDDQERGFYAGLFYNVTGQFLYAAGLEVPDIYEQPAPSLDFNLTQRFADQWSFTFRGKNLLNPVYRQTQTYQGTVYDYFQYTKGWDLSLAVNYSF